VSSGDSPDVKMTVTLCSVVDKYQYQTAQRYISKDCNLNYCCGSLRYHQPKWLVISCMFWSLWMNSTY